MLIAEQLMLLCVDPQRGEFDASIAHVDINSLAAAALILDLSEQRRLCSIILSPATHAS